MPIHLHIFYGCFCTIRADLNRQQTAHALQSQHFLLSVPLQRKCANSCSRMQVMFTVVSTRTRTLQHIVGTHAVALDLYDVRQIYYLLFKVIISGVFFILQLNVFLNNIVRKE